jgi:hypothetical protein
MIGPSQVEGITFEGFQMAVTLRHMPTAAARWLLLASVAAVGLSACSVSVFVAPGDGLPSVGPSPTAETCPTGLLEENGVQVCVQGPFPRQAGNLLVVTFMNPRQDAAALVVPTYTLSASDGTPVADTSTSMAMADKGLLVLPGSGWAIDYRFVSTDVTKVTVMPAVTWLKGKTSYAPYTKLQFHSDCYKVQPFAGCQWINHNAYPIRVRSEIDLIATKTDGSWTVESVVAGGPEVDLAAGSTTLVPATSAQVSAINDWLAADSANRYQQQIETTPDQPEFGNN